MIPFFFKLYWKYHYWRYAFPAKSQIRYIYRRDYKDQHNLRPSVIRRRKVALMYINDWSFEQIAEYLDCTRERVRQILIKISFAKPNEYWYN